MKRQPNNNGGFSLLEVILAMAILAIISIPLLSYFTQSMKYNAMMADKQHATNLAQEVLEDLKNQKELAVVTKSLVPISSVAALVARFSVSVKLSASTRYSSLTFFFFPVPRALPYLTRNLYQYLFIFVLCYL